MLLPWTLNSHSDLCTSQPTLTSDLAPLLAFFAGGRQLEQLHPKNKAQKPNDKQQNKPQ